jgi:2-polyprenyl-6-methoxyphenol hydroxylase-like FAD-dependent oxidoreductase
MTAAELGAAGVPTVVLEKRDEPSLSRAGVLQPRVLEIFAMRGYADRVLELAQELNGDNHRTAGGIWAGLPGIDYGLLDSEYPYITVLSQIEVERLLAERCRELGVEIRRGCEVTGLREGADEIEVLFTDAGADAALRARYVVGADGARSVVRTAAGIGWRGHDARNLAINVDAQLPYPFDEAIHVENTPRGWGLAYPLSESVTRFGVIDAATMLGVGRDHVVDREAAFDALRRVFGSDYGATTARVSQFHDAMFRADAMRSGRVLLVGESVRVHYPASGVGMNFCLQDAFNLAWKMAADLQGWGAPGLLDSYETERGADVDAHLDMVRTQTGIQFDYSDEAIALKNFLMHELIPLAPVKKRIAEHLSGLATRYGARDELVGSPIRNLPVGDGRVFDLVRPDGYLLLVTEGLEAGDAGERVTVASAPLPDGFGQAVVVRPDGYIATAGALEDARAWLRASLGRES